jgi:phosphatidylethanolamine-binding protein (PEBP) family uncharacterized protein
MDQHYVHLYVSELPGLEQRNYEACLQLIRDMNQFLSDFTYDGGCPLKGSVILRPIHMTQYAYFNNKAYELLSGNLSVPHRQEVIPQINCGLENIILHLL